MAAQNLAMVLRGETKQLHTAAERAGIMSAILAGHIERSSYCRLLRNFYELYSALEAALARHASHPQLGALQFAGLSRRAALAADLHFLHGEKWQTEIPLALAATQYASRLSHLETHDPESLIAHSYVRYLGDLSGGQMLRKIVAAALRLEGEAGISFYIFDAPDAVTLAAQYRHALQSIDVDEATQARIVAEAQSAFRRHVDLFCELA